MPVKKLSAVALLSLAEGLNASPLPILKMVLREMFCWAFKDSSSFQIVGCWYERRELNVWWNASKEFVVRADPAADRSRTFHM